MSGKTNSLFSVRCRIPTVGLALMLMACLSSSASSEEKPFTLVVMDPLSAPLACDCVEGYAQRKYEALAEYLQKSLGQAVKLVFSEALGKALDGKAEGRADLVIGKHSVVLSDAHAAKVKLSPVAQLTGKDGKVTQTGLLVVPKDDPAQTVADLKGYRIFFGPADCDEKSAAPMELLEKAGVSLPETIETCPACSDSASKILELGPDAKAVAVISSYAQPLLEGCGTIQKGDLRVIGESKPVPFITAFVNESTPAETKKKVIEALMEARNEFDLLFALESRDGFLPPSKNPSEKLAGAKKNP